MKTNKIPISNTRTLVMPSVKPENSTMKIPASTKTGKEIAVTMRRWNIFLIRHPSAPSRKKEKEESVIFNDSQVNKGNQQEPQ